MITVNKGNLRSNFFFIKICATSGDLVFELSFLIIRIQLKNMSDIRYAPSSHLLAEKTNKQKKGGGLKF